MKKIHFLGLSAILLLLFACGKDDEQPLAPTPLLTVKYGRSNPSDVFIIASKSDGTLLDYKPLYKDSTVTLETIEKGISEFTATLVTISEFNSFHQLYSYHATPVGSTWWLYPLPDSPVTGAAQLVVEGTGSVGQVPFFVTGADSGAIVDTSSGNNIKATYELHNNATEIPVLAIYRSSLDNKVHYYYDPTLSAEQTTTVQHASLPVVESPTAIDLGTANIHFSYIAGIVQTPYNDRATLPISQVVDPTTQITEHYIPEGVFDEYLFHASGKLPNSEREFSSFIYADALVTSFDYPDFEADIDFVDNGFDFSTAADFNHFYLDFFNSKGVSWSVNSAAHASGSFRFPLLPNELVGEYPMMTEPFEYLNTSYIRYTPARSTADYYKFLFPEPGTQEPFYSRQDLLY